MFHKENHQEKCLSQVIWMLPSNSWLHWNQQSLRFHLQVSEEGIVSPVTEEPWDLEGVMCIILLFAYPDCLLSSSWTTTSLPFIHSGFVHLYTWSAEHIVSLIHLPLVQSCLSISFSDLLSFSFHQINWLAQHYGFQFLFLYDCSSSYLQKAIPMIISKVELLLTAMSCLQSQFYNSVSSFMIYLL